MNANFSGIDFELQRRADVITALSADLTTAQEQIRLLEGAIEGAEHAGNCDSRHQCFVCDNENLWPDSERPHSNTCNCFKAVLAPKEPTT